MRYKSLASIRIKVILDKSEFSNVEIVRRIRKEFPEFPVIATGGPTEESIRMTIEAGANAITYTPPSNGDTMSSLMDKYRSI